MPAVNPRNIRSSGPPSLPQVIKEVLDPRPAISDAYWSATHPVDRIMGRGRAKGGQMIFPWGAKFPPKSFPVGPPEAGLTAHRLPVSPDVPLKKETEDTMTWRGNVIRTGYYQGIPRGIPRDSGTRARIRNEIFPASSRQRIRDRAREEQGMPVSYNILDKDGKVVGASHMRLFRNATEVDEIFLKKNIRGSTTILKDMVGPAIDRGLPIRAVPGNPKVGRLLDRLARSHHKGEGRPPVHGDYDPAGRANVDYVAASARARRNVGPAPARSDWGPDPSLVIEPTGRARTVAELMAADRAEIGDAAAQMRAKPPLVRAEALTTGSMIQQRARQAAAASAARERAAAAHRAEMLARMRRAPNPIRQSRPGRGGV